MSDVNPKTAASGRVHPNLIYMTRSPIYNRIRAFTLYCAGLREARESAILRRQHHSGGSNLRSETVGQLMMFSLLLGRFHDMSPSGEVYWWTESEAQALYAQRLGVQLQVKNSVGDINSSFIQSDLKLCF